MGNPTGKIWINCLRTNCVERIGCVIKKMLDTKINTGPCCKAKGLKLKIYVIIKVRITDQGTIGGW